MAILFQGLPASGLDIFLRFNGVLTDPLAITYIIKIPNGTPVVSGSGFKRSVGHYDARNSIIPSGYDISNPWEIDWTYTAPNSIISSSSEEFTVVDNMSATFNDVTNVIDLVKDDIDVGSLTDAQIESLIEKSLIRLNRKLRLTGSSALHIDETTGDIMPEPTDAILDLIILQTECLVSKKNRSTSVATNRTHVKDGDQEVDISSNANGQIAVTKDFCDELDDAVKDYMDSVGGGAGNFGQLIWHGNSRQFESTVNGDKDMRSPFETDC